MSLKKILRPAVLYCHGLGATSTSGIAYDIKKLTESRQFVFRSVNYRDTGNLKRIWNVDHWMEDILTEINALGRPIILIGNSAGCHSVLRAALLKQDAVKGLILMAPGVGLNFDSYSSIVLPHLRSQLQCGRTALHPPAPNGVPVLIDLKCLTRFVEVCPSNSMDRIPVHCPIRIVHGDHDKVVPLRNVETFVRKLESKDVEMEVLKGVGHYIPITKKFEVLFDRLLQISVLKTN